MPEDIVRYAWDESSVEIREANADDPDAGRIITGLAVPYDERAQIAPGVFERIAPGAFAGSEHVVLRTEHGQTIGTVQFRDTDRGLEIQAKVSRTQAGDEALTLLRDGVLDRLSVGFQPADGGTKVERDGTLLRTKGRLLEVSLTGIPIYQKAKVLSLREVGHGPTEVEGNTMPDNEIVELRAEVTELRQANEDITRRLATLQTERESGPANPLVHAAQFRSAGEWLKAIVGGDKGDDYQVRDAAVKAAMEIRAFAGTTTADTNGTFAPTTWIADAIRIAQDNQVAVDRFRRAPLPATGNVMEYLTMGASTLQVQEQVAEGDVLAFGKLNLDSASTGLKTYGGYTSFSFQAIRRSPINIVDTAYSLLVREAAKRRNAALVAKLINGGAFSGVSVGNAVPATFDDWVATLIAQRMAQQATGLGLPVDSYLVSSDVYTTLIGVKDGETRLLALPGVTYGANATTAGTLTLPNGQAGGLPAGLGGTLLGLPVYVEPALAAGTMLAIARDAAVVFGDDNPARLGPDNDITNLTSEISVYFEMGAATQFADGIQKFVLA